METVKNAWCKLRSRTKKVIKTFVQAGAAYVATYLTASAADLDSEAIKALILSALAAGLAAVMNINDNA